LADGQIVASGGPDLAHKLEEQGYTWLEQGGIQSVDVELRA
jgi:Fe-S cluster assembly ATPase SufC